MKLQTDDFSCGPVAIINAYYYKHSEYPKNITIKRLTHICETNQEYGTYRWNIKKNPIIKLEKSVYNTKKILGMNRFILLYSFSFSNRVCAHYIFVEKDNDIYKLYNYFDSDENNYVNRSMDKFRFIEKLIKNNPTTDDELDYPLAWEIV